MDDVVKDLTEGVTGQLNKLELIYNHLQQLMKWDRVNSVFAGKNLKKAYSDKLGNSRISTFYWWLCLNSAGIYADPVISEYPL